MHEANFELIEIPHVRQSGKNSADIRLVVDALDLCYTKSHVNTFVIISGDSDFSPLVSKLRENAKQVIGVGVKQSTSDLLIANCDEFIFYDDLVREKPARHRPRQPRRAARRHAARPKKSAPAAKEEPGRRRTRAWKWPWRPSRPCWPSAATAARSGPRCSRKPSSAASPISARAYGFRSLRQPAGRSPGPCGLLEFGRDEKSGAYVNECAYRCRTGAGRRITIATSVTNVRGTTKPSITPEKAWQRIVLLRGQDQVSHVGPVVAEEDTAFPARNLAPGHENRQAGQRHRQHDPDVEGQQRRRDMPGPGRPTPALTVPGSPGC
jgi:hypothetical protein